MIDAFGFFGVDSSRPREAARQIGLDKSLVWKLTRIVHEQDECQIAQSIPGAQGIQLLIKELKKQKGSGEVVGSIESAYRDYSQMVSQHSGTKDSLELMLMGQSSGLADSRLKSRLHAYKGNSGIWGIQSAARISSHILTVNPDDPARLNYAQIGGLVDFRRLCPGPNWPLFRFHSYDDVGSKLPASMKPISESPNPERPLILDEHCQGTLPQLHLACETNCTSYEIGEGQLGNMGKCDIFFGYIDANSVPRFSDEKNKFGELLCIIDTPIENLLFDLIVQRELADEINPEVLVYGRATGPQLGHELRDSSTLIPCADSLRRLEPGEHMLSSPIAHRYSQIGEQVFKQHGKSSSDYICWRLEMKYPIMPSTVAVKYTLRDR